MGRFDENLCLIGQPLGYIEHFALGMPFGKFFNGFEFYVNPGFLALYPEKHDLVIEILPPEGRHSSEIEPTSIIVLDNFFKIPYWQTLKFYNGYRDVQNEYHIFEPGEHNCKPITKCHKFNIVEAKCLDIRGVELLTFPDIPISRSMPCGEDALNHKKNSSGIKFFEANISEPIEHGFLGFGKESHVIQIASPVGIKMVKASYNNIHKIIYALEGKLPPIVSYNFPFGTIYLGYNKIKTHLVLLGAKDPFTFGKSPSEPITIDVIVIDRNNQKNIIPIHVLTDYIEIEEKLVR